MKWKCVEMGNEVEMPGDGGYGRNSCCFFLKFKTNTSIVQKLAILLFCVSLFSCQPSRTTFYAFADLPYKESEVEKLKAGVQAINRDESHDFSIHLGDIKAGKAPCERWQYEQTWEILKRLDKPTFIIPGDNEWNDCPDPDSAWPLWEEHFMEFDQNWPAPKFEVARQPARRENFAFVHRRCLFVGLNLVGGRVHDEVAWKDRLNDDIHWLKKNFSTHQNKVKCAVVFGHAQPPAGAGHPNNRLFDALKAAALEFRKPVLFMHGDGHVLEIERFLADNLLRLELNGGKENDWLMKVVVEAGEEQPFRILLPVP